MLRVGVFYGAWLKMCSYNFRGQSSTTNSQRDVSHHSRHNRIKLDYVEHSLLKELRKHCSKEHYRSKKNSKLDLALSCRKRPIGDYKDLYLRNAVATTWDEIQTQLRRDFN
jgi:hypothetical protein